MSKVLKQGVLVSGRKYVQLVHMDEIQVDDSYQRPMSPGNLEIIGGSNFNEEAVGVLLLGERVGTKVKYVIDGRHRLTVQRDQRQKGLKDDYVLSTVIRGTTVQEEADLFVYFNTNKPVTGNIRFRARLLCGHSPEAEIEKIVKKNGFELSFLPPGKPKAGNLLANGLRGEGVMLKAYENYGQDKFTTAIEVLKKYYSEQYLARQGMFIYGLTLFCHWNPLLKAASLQKLKGTHAETGIRLAEAESKYSSGKYKRIAQWLCDVCGINRLGSKEAA